MNTAEYLNTLIECKEDMKSAIIEKGVTPTGGLSTYADAIDNIPIGSWAWEALGKQKTEDCIERNAKNINSTTGVWNLNSESINSGNFPSLADWLYWGYPKWKITSENGTYQGLSGIFSIFSNLLYIPWFDVGSLTNASYLFANCKNLIAIGGFDTSKIKSLDCAFQGCNSLKNIILDTQHIECMSGMFDSCTSLLATPNILIDNLLDAHSMFTGCTSLKTVTLNLSNNKITNANSMFDSCTELTDFTSDIYIGNIKTARGMFTGCTSLLTVPNLTGMFNTTLQPNISYMFSNCWGLTEIDKINIKGAAHCDSLFLNCRNIISVGEMDTSNVISISSMFESCDSLKTVPALNTSNVLDAEDVFRYCDELEDFGGFINLGMERKFHDATGQTVDFHSCKKLTKQSLLNIINNLYNRLGNYGDDAIRPISFSYESILLLSDEEKAIATNKGWEINVI